VVGDPAGAPAGVGVVVAEDLDGELGVELGDGLAELAQVAPGAALEIGEGALGDVAGGAVGGALGVEAPGEDAEQLGIVARFGELVDALEAAPEAEAEVGLAGELDEDGAGGAGVALVEGDEEVGEGEARGEGDVLLGEVALPGVAGAGMAGLGGAAGLGLGEEGLEGVEGEGALGELVGGFVGLLEEGQHGLSQVGRFRPGQPLQVRCRQLVARGHRADGFTTGEQRGGWGAPLGPLW